MNSFDLLNECQGVRRRDPKTKHIMDLIIDLLGEGDVSLKIDEALERIEARRRVA